MRLPCKRINRGGLDACRGTFLLGQHVGPSLTQPPPCLRAPEGTVISPNLGKDTPYHSASRPPTGSHIEEGRPDITALDRSSVDPRQAPLYARGLWRPAPLQTFPSSADI
eukprot:scaffold1183_cov418-Prasinococcus_capsulatus_cf.AAC.36